MQFWEGRRGRTKLDFAGSGVTNVPEEQHPAGPREGLRCATRDEMFLQQTGWRNFLVERECEMILPRQLAPEEMPPPNFGGVGRYSRRLNEGGVHGGPTSSSLTGIELANYIIRTAVASSESQRYNK